MKVPLHCRIFITNTSAYIVQDAIEIEHALARYRSLLKYIQTTVTPVTATVFFPENSLTVNYGDQMNLYSIKNYESTRSAEYNSMIINSK